MTANLSPASARWLARLEEAARRAGWTVERNDPEPGDLRATELFLTRRDEALQIFVTPSVGNGRNRRSVRYWTHSTNAVTVRLSDVFDRIGPETTPHRSPDFKREQWPPIS